ncbi:MAG: 16S rRNA processing protein RimM [Candidatus Zixiibacteriota bacterium]|nr:MAG: 16S rRNA processing protein RimM [candidate division Zixibacteria bacterium]
MSATRYIEIGRLGRTRGVAGEMYVTPLTDFPERFLDMREVHVSVQGEWRLHRLESTRIIGGRPVVKFAGVDSPEDAARLTNLLLAVPQDKVVSLPEGSYYVFDLIECDLIDDTSGECLGHVRDVRRFPANDVYVVATTDGREVLFPAVKAFVRRVDIAARKIFVMPGGMFDLPPAVTAE